MVVLINLYPNTLFPVTLLLFQGHSSVKNNFEVEVVFINIFAPDQLFFFFFFNACEEDHSHNYHGSFHIGVRSRAQFMRSERVKRIVLQEPMCVCVCVREK